MSALLARGDRALRAPRQRRAPAAVQKADIGSAAAALILGRWFAGERRNLMTGKAHDDQLRPDGSLRLLTLQGLPAAERLLARRAWCDRWAPGPP
jgi:hypothetical protein